MTQNVASLRLVGPAAEIDEFLVIAQRNTQQTVAAVRCILVGHADSAIAQRLQQDNVIEALENLHTLLTWLRCEPRLWALDPEEGSA